MVTPTRRKKARSAIKRVKRHTTASKHARRKLRQLQSRKHRKSFKKYIGGGNVDINTYVLYDKIPTTLNARQNGLPTTLWVNVPVCLIFMVKKTVGKDDIYLFFNKKMTKLERTTTVKLLLGIGISEPFALEPDIEVHEDDKNANEEIAAAAAFVAAGFAKGEKEIERLSPNFGQPYVFDIWQSLSRNFVKLTGYRSYSVETGTLPVKPGPSSDDSTPLGSVTTTKHTIQTTNKAYTDLNGKAIEDNIGKFAKAVLASGRVLPDLYKKYYTVVSTEVPKVEPTQPVVKEPVVNNEDIVLTIFDDESKAAAENLAVVQDTAKAPAAADAAEAKAAAEIEDIFGPDVEGYPPLNKPPGREFNEAEYAEFKEKTKESIKSELEEAKKHLKYGLSRNVANKLNKERPLETLTLLNSMPANDKFGIGIINWVLNGLTGNSYSAYDYLKYIFVVLPENWWEAMEKDEIKKKVETLKEARIVACHPILRTHNCVKLPSSNDDVEVQPD